MIDEFTLGKHSALSVAISECLHAQRKLMHLQLFAFHNGNTEKIKNAIDSINDAYKELDLELRCFEKELLGQINT